MLTTSAAGRIDFAAWGSSEQTAENSDARFEGRGFELRVGADAPSAQPSKARLYELSPTNGAALDGVWAYVCVAKLL